MALGSRPDLRGAPILGSSSTVSLLRLLANCEGSETYTFLATYCIEVLSVVVLIFHVLFRQISGLDDPYLASGGMDLKRKPLQVISDRVAGFTKCLVQPVDLSFRLYTTGAVEC